MAARLNAARRHLTDAQRVLLGKKIEPHIAANAKERQGERTDLATSCSPDQKVSDRTPEASLTRSEVAREVGIGSGITYQRHKQVIAQAREEAPDLMPSIESGDLSIADVTRQPWSPSAPAPGW